MKVFLINLNHNTDRLAQADCQLRRLGVVYERFPAVYGREMPAEERRRAVAVFHSWCAMGRRLLDGEVGCALSHCGIYRRIVSENIPCALILEDDIAASDTLPDALRQVEAFCDPARPQVVLLTHHTESAPPVGVSRIYGEMFTEGYVITCAGAKALLRANYPLVTVADAWSRWAGRGEIELYKCYPPVLTQDWERFSTSDINVSGRPRVADYSFWRWGGHKSLRFIGRVLDGFSYLLLRR